MRSLLLAAAAILSVTTSPAETAAYKKIDLDDVKVDKGQMRGQKIEVRGLIQIVGEVAMIKSSPEDMTPIFVDISRLVRLDRKKIITECSATCQIFLQGSIGTVMMQTGIIAEFANIN